MRKRNLIAGMVGVSVAAAAAMRGLFSRFAIRERSMEPALEEGDWVIAKRRTSDLDRGDIVVFDDPTGSGINLVKRVIGLPGEAAGILNGRVTINGALLADRWASGTSRPDGSWDVPNDHVWLLGDNRSASASDGRVTGPTSLSEIQWVVVARYFPTARAGKVS